MARLLVRTLFVALGVFSVAGCGTSKADTGRNGATRQLLNVSYDPTRELWKALNEKFVTQYEQVSGVRLEIKQSHGGSSSQARAVIDGLEADVVTLAMWGDTQAIAEAGLIKDEWSSRLPNGALPYSSTIVFVVRKGNPKHIADWPDLVREDVEVITPTPKTSANGKLSFLAAWGSVLLRDGSEEDARTFVTELYRHVPVLDSGARGATMTFAQKQIGDVHLTWENEAHFEVAEARGALELVYPPISIRAEPRVAVVDANVDRHGTRAEAEAYLQFLYTPEAQEIIAEHYYRPSKPEVLHKHADKFGHVEQFTIQNIASGWEEADVRFFGVGGVFDQVYESIQK